MYRLKEEYKKTYIIEVWGVKFTRLGDSSFSSSRGIYEGYFKFPFEKTAKLHAIPYPDHIMEPFFESNKSPKDWL